MKYCTISYYRLLLRYGIIAALRDYEYRVIAYTDELAKLIATFSGKPLTASKRFNFYSFGVMGDPAFGKSFGMLKLLREGMMPIGILSPAPWLLLIMARIPGAANGYKRFLASCNEQVEERKKVRKQEAPHDGLLP